MLHESANCLLIEYQSTILSHFLKPRRLSCTSGRRLGGIRMCTGSVCFHLIKQRRESLIVLYYVLLCTKPALIYKCRIIWIFRLDGTFLEFRRTREVQQLQQL